MMEFEMYLGELLMKYYPEMEYDSIQRKIEEGESVKLKNTFSITQNQISNKLDVVIRITNPQGMLLMGRSNEFSIEERFDFEIIKRQHKNIVDIMTYDELIERLENIIRQLLKKTSSN